MGDKDMEDLGGDLFLTDGCSAAISVLPGLSIIANTFVIKEIFNYIPLLK